MRTRLLTVLGAMVLSVSAPAQEGASAPYPKFNLDFNLGGFVPTGPTKDAFKESLMIGGGAKVAASRYFSWDALLVDFGFGSAGGSRVIRLTDQSTRSTANYSLFLTSGWGVSAPLVRGSSARVEASA